MSIHLTAASARSDVARTLHHDARPTRPYRRHGLLLAGGAAVWAAGMAVYGLEPGGDVEVALSALSSGAFQLGLLALLRVFWQSQALGSGGIARGALRLESVLVVLAIGSTLADASRLSDLDKVGWALLDACWPLSMMGMMFLGIRVAIAGRWRGASRVWPLVAESWAPVVLPVYGIFGAAVAQYVAPLHLLVGYTVLGMLVARKEG